MAKHSVNVFKINNHSYNFHRVVDRRNENIKLIKSNKYNTEELINKVSCPQDIGYENTECSDMGCNDCCELFIKLILKGNKKSNVK